VTNILDPKTKRRRDRALLRLTFRIGGIDIDVSLLSGADVKEGAVLSPMEVDHA
jgi:hypothetical protein